MSVHSPTLAYATAQPAWRPGVGFAVIAIINLLSLGVTVAYERAGVIGDSNGPLLGLFNGVPFTFVTALAGTFPAVVYATHFWATGSRRCWLVALAAVSSLSVVASAALTAACIVTPRP